jgi:hypothetical protein
MSNKWMIGLAVLLIAGGLGGWYYWQSRSVLPTTVPITAQPPTPAPQEPAIAHPLPDSGGGALDKTPLPELADSDSAIDGALGEIFGAAAVKDYLVPGNVVRRIIMIVDNLPRQKIGVDKRPVGFVSGVFIAVGDEQHATLDSRNFARYKPMVGLVSTLDVPKLAAVYVHFYPLLQQAYQDLGSANGYFNDRLVEVIDVLLAAPAPTGPIDLIRPKVMYEYADPALEARPAGQKLLIRMGPENAGVIKAKLTELRAAVTAAPMKR